MCIYSIALFPCLYMTLTFLHMYSPPLWLPAAADTSCPVSRPICCPVCTQVSAEHTETPCQICLVSQTGQPLKGSCCPSFFFFNSHATTLHPTFSGSRARDYQTNINTLDENLKEACHCWQVPEALRKCSHFGFSAVANRKWCLTASALCSGAFSRLVTVNLYYVGTQITVTTVTLLQLHINLF